MRKQKDANQGLGEPVCEDYLHLFGHTRILETPLLRRFRQCSYLPRAFETAVVVTRTPTVVRSLSKVFD